MTTYGAGRGWSTGDGGCLLLYVYYLGGRWLGDGSAYGMDLGLGSQGGWKSLVDILLWNIT